MAEFKPGTHWTDEELGYLQDHAEDMSAADLSRELGRSVQSIYSVRRKLRRGWFPYVAPPWEPDEDAIIRELGPHIPPVEMLDRLPGRTSEAIRKRRDALGVNQPPRINRDPNVVAARPLIAKTCSKCGLLLSASWFTFGHGPRRNSWSSACKRCHVVLYSLDGAEAKRKHAVSAADSFAKMQAITLPNATRGRMEWTAADESILRDPDLSILQKALAARRSYAATVARCNLLGIRTREGLGDPERDQWNIDNPSANFKPEPVPAPGGGRPDPMW